MDVCPIAASDISAWLGIHQIVDEEGLELYWLVRALDHVYLQWNSKKNSAIKNKHGSNTQRSNRR